MPLPWPFSRKYPEKPPEFANAKEFDYIVIGEKYQFPQFTIHHSHKHRKMQAVHPAVSSHPVSAIQPPSKPPKSSSSNAVPQTIPTNHESPSSHPTSSTHQAAQNPGSANQCPIAMGNNPLFFAQMYWVVRVDLIVKCILVVPKEIMNCGRRWGMRSGGGRM